MDQKIKTSLIADTLHLVGIPFMTEKEKMHINNASGLNNHGSPIKKRSPEKMRIYKDKLTYEDALTIAEHIEEQYR